MCACCVPQNSAHSPRYHPALVALSHMVLSCPGITSVLPPSCGTQKLWMTLSEIKLICTTVLVGIHISSAVTTLSLGYWNSHHHWWPMAFTVIVLGVVGGSWMLNIVVIVATST